MKEKGYSRKRKLGLSFLLFFLVCYSTILGQTPLLRGRVTDSQNIPLVGVNVVEKGTSNGTVTDMDGNYSLKVSDNATIVFSYIGFKNQEVKWDGKNALDIVMQEDSELLSEVVVVGYGVQKKSDLTGSIASVNRETIESVPVTNLVSALQGQVPGLLASNTSWNPGDGPEIFIRGKRSINASNDPLFVVDGTPMTSEINGLNQYDIESVEVLKDASATAIYGSRGANGVVLITTKQGSEGKTTIDYNGYVGVQTIQNRVEMMNGGEYAEFTREAYRNSTRANKYLSDKPDMEQDKLLPMFKQDPYVLESVLMGYDNNGNYNPDNVRWHDWFSDISQNALITNHSLSIRGGNQKTNFLTSVSYNFTDGIIKDKNYKRYTIRLNLNHSINDFIKVGIQSQYANFVKQRGSEMEEDSYLYRITPLGRFVNEDGSLPFLIGADAQMYNPMLNLQPGAIDRPLKTNQYLGNFYAEFKLPIDGLRFRSNLGLDFRSVQDYQYFAKETTNRQNGTSYASNGTSQKNMYTWENYFTYDKDLSDKHHINLTLLQSIQQDENEMSSSAVEKLPTNSLKYYDLGAGLLINNVSSGYTKWNLASFMGRVNYNLLDKYLFTISARYDGSSRLAEGHKWVLFPSAAFAWRASEEQFIKEVGWINNLKIRFGYGKTGNSAIDPYQTKGTIARNYYVFGNGATEVIGYTPSEMMNNNLTWETTDQWNMGLDFGFFGNRINGSIDYYLQNTYDLLLERQLPVVSGFTSIMSNIGKTRNNGIEVFLNVKNIDNRNFTWRTDWTFSYNKQKIVELYDGKIDDVGNRWFIGYPIDVYYDYEKIGIWQNTSEDLAEIEKFNANGGSFAPGKIRLKDVDGDYKITDTDRVILGHRYPTTMIGMNNYLKYRNFDFSILLYSNLGGTMKNTFEFMEKPGRANALKLIDYWTPSNPTNAFPRPSVDQERVDYAGTLGYDKTDFIRIRNITFGYSLPNKLLNNQGINNLRIYFAANNPYINTKFTGIDPEGASGKTTPSISTWMFGADLTF
ncbi:MAG: TonB-dependent receptor [Porphyromonadaceae bacterium]|nr:TonB-dependent receptor [Porphyromonadaceae bacterium]